MTLFGLCNLPKELSDQLLNEVCVSLLLNIAAIIHFIDAIWAISIFLSLHSRLKLEQSIAL